MKLGADPWYQHQQRPNRPALGSVPSVGKTNSMNLNFTNLNELFFTNLNELIFFTNLNKLNCFTNINLHRTGIIIFFFKFK